MNDPEWQRVRELFEALCDLEPAAAQSRLGAVDAAEPDVAAEVRSLLEHHNRAGEFLSQPAAERIDEAFDEERLETGSVVGTYTVDREIGRGGMGRVYLATDTRLGRAVALKVLPAGRSSDVAQRERLRREARVAATLSHPGINTVYALEESDGHLVIVSEYIDGRSLRAEIGDGLKPGAFEVERAAFELVDALANAHEHGVTHRDIKPENIMRARNGRLKILDFGLALVSDASALIGDGRLTLPGAVMGTPAYMAPEQLEGGAAGQRSDVFSLGVVLYEYATGVHPFGAATPLATAARVLEGAPLALRSARPDLSPAVIDAVDRALRRAPEDRFPSATEFRRALDMRPAPTRGADGVATWWRRHQWTAILLYLLASATAWQVKEWMQGVAGTLFLLIGMLAVVAGVFRGHLVFAERMNHATFPNERRRAAPVTLATDVSIGLALLIDGVLLSSLRPVWSLLVMGLGIGVALARLVVERATAEGAFDRAAHP